MKKGEGEGGRRMDGMDGRMKKELRCHLWFGSHAMQGTLQIGIYYELLTAFRVGRSLRGASFPFRVCTVGRQPVKVTFSAAIAYPSIFDAFANRWQSLSNARK